MNGSGRPAAPQSRFPGVAQPKASAASQMRRPPVAPPVYRPQPVPRVLKSNTPVAQRPAKQTAPVPIASRVCQTQLVAGVLQSKRAGNQGSQKGKSPRGMVSAPGPQKIVPPKFAGNLPASKHPKAPLITRLVATPRVLQTKIVEAQIAVRSLRIGPSSHTTPASPSTGLSVIQRSSAASSSSPTQQYVQKGDNTCWAAAFALVLGKKEHEIKLYAKLDSAINSLAYDDTEPLAKEVGLTLVKNWHDAAMQGKVPIAVGLPNHWVVVTKVAKNQSNTRIAELEYFDPWDGKLSTVGADVFATLTPSIGAHR